MIEDNSNISQKRKPACRWQQNVSPSVRNNYKFLKDYQVMPTYGLIQSFKASPI